jgi:glycosyltransferase involved in cell wall biosynthesis
MKILYVNFEYPPLGGGGGVINAHLAEEMAKRHKVYVLTSQAFGLPEESVENGVRVVRTPVYFRDKEPVANLLSMMAFIPNGIAVGKKLLERQKFDLINTHFVLPSGPVGDALARHAGIPHVLTMHGGDLYDPSKFTSPHRHLFLRAWVRKLIKRADAVVGGSINTLENMRKFYTPELKGNLIPLGIKRPDCYPNHRREYGFHDDDILMVTVGRLVPRKAIDQLISMMGRLKQDNVHLLVVGKGPEEPNLKESARRLDVSQQVHFYGFVEDCEKFRLLGMSDIFVSTSQHEGFCLSFLEAMHGGIPIVSYDYGGHTDYLEDGKTGFVVPLNNLDLFIHQTKQLVDSKKLRTKMGKFNRRLVEEFYIDNCAKKYEAIFQKTVDMKKGSVDVSLLKSRTAFFD